MPKTIQQAIAFSVPPERLYRTYVSAREHAAACGWGKAAIDPRPGGRMALAPHIRGRFLLLVPGRLIVQTWRGSDWKPSEVDSVLILGLHRSPGGPACRWCTPTSPTPTPEASRGGGEPTTGIPGRDT